MAYSKKDIRLKFQQVITGFETSTQNMSSATTEILQLSCPASKVSVQSTGNLVVDWYISVNGENFISVASGLAANTLSSYNTHNVSAVKVVWVSGSGRLAIAGVS